MKIIICGAGQVGTGITRQLVSEGHDVTVIDDNPELIRKINESLEAATIHAFPSHPPVLEQAGAANADMIIAVMLSDEVNMIICEVAHSLFKVPTKIARIRNQNYLQPIWKDLYRQEHLAIDYIISPEREIARTILNRLHAPGAIDMIPLAENRIKMVEIRCTAECTALNSPIGTLQKQASGIAMKVVGVERNGTLIIPESEETLQRGDGIFVVADTNHLHKVMAFFNHEEKEARRIVIFGGGNIGYYLALGLEAEGQDANVKIIELNQARAEFIASRLKDTTVLNGSSLDKQILDEAGIGQAETALGVTNDDEVNIFSCLLAKQFGCKRVIALVNKSIPYGTLISSLGIDATVNPRETTVSSILQYIRRGNVRAAHSIAGGQGEIIEIQVQKLSALVGRSIEDLDLPEGVVVGAIYRNGKTAIPDKDTIFADGDTVILLSRTDQVRKVDKIFAAHLDFF